MLHAAVRIGCHHAAYGQESGWPSGGISDLAGRRVLTSRGHSVVEVPAGGDAQFGDVFLLRSELAVRVDLAFADLLAGGEQFAARALGEGFGADRVEQLIGGVQLVAGVEPPVLKQRPRS